MMISITTVLSAELPNACIQPRVAGTHDIVPILSIRSFLHPRNVLFFRCGEAVNQNFWEFIYGCMISARAGMYISPCACPCDVRMRVPVPVHVRLRVGTLVPACVSLCLRALTHRSHSLSCEGKQRMPFTRFWQWVFTSIHNCPFVAFRYPQIDGKKLPWSIAVAPTEPVLKPTRQVIQPVGGVDVSPIVWVAFLSFVNEILLGPQGILNLLQRKLEI